jgi:hypothetical protein
MPGAEARPGDAVRPPDRAVETAAYGKRRPFFVVRNVKVPLAQ